MWDAGIIMLGESSLRSLIRLQRWLDFQKFSTFDIIILIPRHLSFGGWKVCLNNISKCIEIQISFHRSTFKIYILEKQNFEIER